MKEFIAKFSPFNFLMLLAAGIINAIGVTLFIAPVQLYDSGISGTSILLSQLTPPSLSLSFFLIVLNIPLFLLGWRLIGGKLLVSSLYAIHRRARRDGGQKIVDDLGDAGDAAEGDAGGVEAPDEGQGIYQGGQGDEQGGFPRPADELGKLFHGGPPVPAACAPGTRALTAGSFESHPGPLP